MENKKYTMNGEPASAEDLIDEARQIDEEYNQSWIQQTSIAARILRENGYVIGYNKEEGK